MSQNKLSTYAWWSMAWGLGLAPVGPGTAGTLFGVVLACFLSLMPPLYALFLLIVITCYSIYAADVFAQQLPGKDPAIIVSDEVIGFMWSVIGYPCHVSLYVCAFILFRFFDIAKPGPVHWFDSQQWGGASIVLDDCCAGVMTWICLYILMYYHIIV